MTTLPTPTASRLQPPSWRDSRLVVGVLLVLAATALGARVVGSMDQTVPVYAAATAIVPGQPVTQDDLKVVRVRLTAGEGTYLSADRRLGADRYAVREVRPGELLPSTALGDRTDVDVRPLTLSVATEAASGLVQGSVVDVWVSPRDPDVSTEKYLAPRRLVEAASVARTPERERTLGGAAGTTGVEVLVPESGMQDLIAAVDGGARVTLVRAPGSTRANPS